MSESLKIRCLTVDDEPLGAALISSYVRRTPFLILVGEANSAEEALEILGREAIDLVFLDIRMPRLSGMELARVIPESTRIVFTTAYADHAVEGFRVNALDYLLKPVSFEEFSEAAKRALKEFESRESSMQLPVSNPASGFLTVKSEYKILRIPLDTIEYVEGLKDYVKIFTTDAPGRPVLTLMSMKNVEESLGQDTFMRVHRSFIVNMDKVRVIERNCIIMGERAIPVSDSYKRAFLSRMGFEE